MLQNKSIKTSFERNVQAMTLKPEIAQNTKVIKAKYDHEGLACDIEFGSWKLKADMPEKAGGTETGPAPGDYMGTALASCQLISIVLWAAHYDVPVDNVELELQIDKDSRGLYGVGDQPPRWSAMTFNIEIESTAPETEIRKVLDAANAHSPMRDNLEHAFAINRKVTITTPQNS
ncbi:MAG TPA: OsmC family protein [Balneolaceae bacterium]|nr:OsmC family protein [Balneolaceae bacterium]